MKSGAILRLRQEGIGKSVLPCPLRLDLSRVSEGIITVSRWDRNGFWPSTARADLASVTPCVMTGVVTRGLINFCSSNIMKSHEIASSASTRDVRFWDLNPKIVENRPLKAVFFCLLFLQFDAEFSNPNPGDEAFHGGQAGPEAHGFAPRTHGQPGGTEAGGQRPAFPARPMCNPELSGGAGLDQRLQGVLVGGFTHD